jgi:hypothetical protein
MDYREALMRHLDDVQLSLVPVPGEGPNTRLGQTGHVTVPGGLGAFYDRV